MSREIRFKAKFKKISNDKEFWQEILLQKNHITALDNMSGYMQITDWLQSTGKKDKTNKMIFEGDVLTPSAYKNVIKDKRFKCEVIFKKGMFCFAINKPFIDIIKPLYKSLNLGKTAGNEYEIIGNIHQ